MRLWNVERHAARRGPRLKETRRDPAHARFSGPDVSDTKRFLRSEYDCLT